MLCFTASGTGAMDAAVSNLFSKGDKVIVCTAGKFGERWVEIAQAYQLDATVIQAEYGDFVTPDRVESRAQSPPALRAFSSRLPNPRPARRTMSIDGSNREENGCRFRGGCDYGSRYHASRYRWLGS